MNKFAIVTDGSNDMTRDLRERFGIDDYIKGVVEFPDGHQEYADLDWEVISPEEYYGSMSKKSVYQSAIGSQTVLEGIFEKYLSQGMDVLFITISTALSGTYPLGIAAGRNMMEKYPDRKVICVDTLRYCSGAGLLAAKAGELRKSGKSIEEVVKWLEDNKRCVHQMGTVDDLYFLHRTGRISSVNAFFGSFISIKPMAEVNAKGLSQVIGKTKGYNNLYKVTLEYIKKTIKDPENQIVFVTFSNRKVQADKLAELIRNEIHPKEVIQTRVCMASGASIGPGMVAAFYLGDPVSENLEKETAILNGILSNM